MLRVEGFAAGRVDESVKLAGVEGLLLGVFCEGGDVADPAELTCEIRTAKALSKLITSLNKCYDRCFANARKVPPVQPMSDCAPPGDGPTAACIAFADFHSIAGVNKKCSAIGESSPGANNGTTALPDCSGTNDYPDGVGWTDFIEGASSGNIPGTYCGSPSGAFLE